LCFRGHGTYAEDDVLKASVAGVMQKVNKLICIRPLKSRYVGEIGDVIVGRILEVQQKRWKVETNSRLDSVLQLSAVNLPGGELVWHLYLVCFVFVNKLQKRDIILNSVVVFFININLNVRTSKSDYNSNKNCSQRVIFTYK
jgi:exosome complex component RRP4